VSAESLGSEPLGHGEGCARRRSAHVTAIRSSMSGSWRARSTCCSPEQGARFPQHDLPDQVLRLGRQRGRRGLEFTQRGMRRTYNDLSRAANVKPEIIRSISGHHTEQMGQVLDLPLAGEERRYRRGHRARDGAQSLWRGTRRVRRRRGRRGLGRGGTVGV